MVTQVHSRTDDKGRRKCCLFVLTVNLHNNISSEYSIASLNLQRHNQWKNTGVSIP